MKMDRSSFEFHVENDCPAEVGLVPSFDSCGGGRYCSECWQEYVDNGTIEIIEEE